MIRLLKKDISVYKGYFIVMLFAIPILLYIDMETNTFVSVFTVLFIFNVVLEGRNNKVNRFLLSMPLLRKTVMKEKYIFFFLFLLFIGLYSWLTSSVLLSSIIEISSTKWITIFLGLIITAAVLIPTMLYLQKFENISGYIILVFVFTVCYGIMVFINEMDISLSVLIPLAVAGITIYFLSMLISVRIFEKRDYNGE